MLMVDLDQPMILCVWDSQNTPIFHRQSVVDAERTFLGAFEPRVVTFLFSIFLSVSRCGTHFSSFKIFHIPCK